MIEVLFDKLAKLHFRLFGSKRLKPNEQLCLDAWRASLPENSRSVLEAQLKSAYLVQRQAGGAKVCFFYPDNVLAPLFKNQEPNHHVATVVLRATENSEKQRMAVKIFVHRGRFFSIEFPKRPERYLEQHGMKGMPLQVADVVVHQQIR